MKTIIQEMKENLSKLLDSTEDKQYIEQIGAMSSIVDRLEVEHNTLQEENKQLIKDYKELIKHTSFAPTGIEQEVADTKVPDFGDFLTALKNQNN